VLRDHKDKLILKDNFVDSKNAGNDIKALQQSESNRG
jgi:hypothetical protein